MAINLEASFGSAVFAASEVPATSASISPTSATAPVSSPYTFDGSGSSASTFAWSFTSVPGGSSLTAGGALAFPDSGATTPFDMTDNEGLWHFEGDANDTSGNSRNGTVTGASLVTGKIGSQAYQFGTSDYIGFGAASTFLTASDDFSVSIWMKGDAAWTPANYDCILGFSNGFTWSQGFGLYFTNATTIRAFVGSYTGGFIEATIGTVSDWNHIAVTYTGGVLRLYVNGEVQARRDVGLTLTGLTNALQIARLGTRGFLEATLDEFAIWSRGLSAAEVKHAYGLASGVYSAGDSLTFTPDAEGTYTVQLAVTGWDLGVAATNSTTATFTTGTPTPADPGFLSGFLSGFFDEDKFT